MELMTQERIDSILARIKEVIGVLPYSQAYVSTLGGIQNASVMFTVGLDKRETWAYGYLENSRYIRFHASTEWNGFELEAFVNCKVPIKIRKCTVKNEEILIKKIQKIVADLLPLV
jgi:hypothetical protein